MGCASAFFGFMISFRKSLKVILQNEIQIKIKSILQVKSLASYEQDKGSTGSKKH